MSAGQPPLAMSRNQAFLAELELNLLEILGRKLSAVGSPFEGKAASEIIGCFGLYALLRQLTPKSVAPNEALYCKM